MIEPNEIIKEIEDAFYDIPFENSAFQNEYFVLQGQYTPARAYRAIGLRMSSKLQAINELKYGRQLEEIDIEEKQALIDSDTASSFDKRRAQVEIDKLLSVRNYTDKLLNDALSDLNFMYTQFKKFPRYTREQFELEERQHFEFSLHAQLDSGNNGAMMSLANMDPQNNALFDTLLLEANNVAGALGVSQ